MHRHARAKQRSRRQFDRWAGGYDRSVLQRVLFRPSHDLLLEELDLSAPSRILDIGCGTCVFGFRVAANSSHVRVFGVDLSREMAGRAKAKRDYCRSIDEPGGEIRITIADSEHLPYADDSLDYVTCANSFHHYPHQEGVVREMHRVLKPGGRALVVDGCKDTLFGSLVFDRIVALVEGDVRHLAAVEFRDLFERCGFGDIRQRTRFRGLPILLTSAAALKPPR